MSEEGGFVGVVLLHLPITDIQYYCIRLSKEKLRVCELPNAVIWKTIIFSDFFREEYDVSSLSDIEIPSTFSNFMEMVRRIYEYIMLKIPNTLSEYLISHPQESKFHYMVAFSPKEDHSVASMKPFPPLNEWWKHDYYGEYKINKDRIRCKGSLNSFYGIDVTDRESYEISIGFLLVILLEKEVHAFYTHTIDIDIGTSVVLKDRKDKTDQVLKTKDVTIVYDVKWEFRRSFVSSSYRSIVYIKRIRSVKIDSKNLRFIDSEDFFSEQRRLEVFQTLTKEKISISAIVNKEVETSEKVICKIMPENVLVKTTTNVPHFELNKCSISEHCNHSISLCRMEEWIKNERNVTSSICPICNYNKSRIS